MATKPNTTAVMQNAAAHGSAHDPLQGCADCNKTGLAILPVVPTLLPNSLRNLNDELKALDGHYKAEDLKTHWYVMRSLPAGYLYVLKPDMTWDGYVVDTEGLLRTMPPGEMPSSPASITPMSKACRRHGDNIPAQVIAVDPTKHAAVWIAFSRYRWTANVLAGYAANTERCRDKRMTKLDVMAAANGSLGTGSKAANAVRFGAQMSEQVGKYVADYTSDGSCNVLNKSLVTPIRSRASQAKALAAKMAEISRNTAGKTGAIVVLRDDLGVAMDLNAMRNAETAKLGAYIAENQRKRFVGDVILGFEKSFVENGHGKQWNERFLKHYDRNKIVADQKTFKNKAEPWEKQINTTSDDVAILNGQVGLNAWWRDFDKADDQSAKDRQQATSACLHGAVKTKAEQALWDQWFKDDPADPYAMLWGAATALDSELGAFLVGKQLPSDTGKLDKFNDIAKNLRDAKHDYLNRLTKRTNEEALAMIGVAMASQITRLKSVNPALYRTAGARVLIVASARTTVSITPTSISVTQTQTALMMAEAAFGPPEASMKRLLDQEVTSNKRVYVVGSNGVDAYAFESTSQTTQKAKVVELWLPDKLAAEINELPKLPAGATLKALPPPRINPFRGLMDYTRSLPGAFAWVGMTLQTINLTNGTKEFINTEGNAADAYFGIASGSLGVFGATSEILSGAMGKMGTRFAATTVAKVAFAGGVLGAVSAWAEGIQLGIKTAQALRNNDLDAAGYYAGATASIVLSGSLAGLGALAVASEAGALTGVLAFLAPAGTVAATIPVWGWIAAGVIFLGIGLTLLWQAIKATDTPMEDWLKGSVYGKGPKVFSPKEEMEKLNDVAYAISIETDWGDAPWKLRKESFLDGYDSFYFSITLPGVGAASMIDCKITLNGKGGRKEIFHETIRPRAAGNKVLDPHIPVMSAATVGRVATQPRYVWDVSPGIRDGGKRYSGRLKVDDDVYSSAEVEIKYWPNSETMPNFVLPKVTEQRTLVAQD